MQGSPLSRYGRDALAVLVILVFVFPIAWWVLASFKPYTAIFSSTPVFFNFHPTLDNYKVTLLGMARLNIEQGVGGAAGGGNSYNSLPSIMQSLIVAIGSTVLATSLATLAAYGLSRFAFKGKQNYVFFILAQRMMPPIAVAIPLFFIFRDLGLRDTLGGLILAHGLINLPLAVLLLKSFMDDVPQGPRRFGDDRRGDAAPDLPSRRAALDEGRARGDGGALLHLLVDGVPDSPSAHHEHQDGAGQDHHLRHLDRDRVGLHHGARQRRHGAELHLHPARATTSGPWPDAGLAQGLSAATDEQPATKGG